MQHEISINLGFSGRWEHREESKILEQFEKLLDTPEEDIFDLLMSNKSQYENILFHRKREIKESSIKKKIQDFAKIKKKLSSEILLNEVEKLSDEFNKKIKQAEYQLKQKIQRLNFLENQPEELLLLFQFDKSTESTIKYNACYTSKIPIKLINHKDVRSVTEEKDYYRIIDLSGFEGWLPKQYYEFQLSQSTKLNCSMMSSDIIETNTNDQEDKIPNLRTRQAMREVELHVIMKKHMNAMLDEIAEKFELKLEKELKLK